MDESLKPAKMIPATGDYADSARLWQGIPGIEATPGGRLWALWYTGETGEGPGNVVAVATCAGGDAPWEPPRFVIRHDTPAVRCYDPCLWLDPLGRLWLFWTQSESYHDGRAGVWAVRAADPEDPQTAWSAPRRICNGVMMNKPFILSTGEWCMPAAVWGAVDPRHPRVPECDRRSNLWVSCDCGATWTLRGGPDVANRIFDEHAAIDRADGSLWMLVRRRDGIGEAVSTDRGRTWTANPDVVFPGPSARFCLRRLRSGKILFVTHVDTQRRERLLARLSEDDGRTWIGGLMIDERLGVSYPDAAEDADGLIHVIYDFQRGDNGERPAERAILEARFRESDIISGAFASQGAKERIVINRATGEPAATKGEPKQ